MFLIYFILIFSNHYQAIHSLPKYLCIFTVVKNKKWVQEQISKFIFI
jgi:hypothetical protein